MLEVFHHPGFVSLAIIIALEEARAPYRCNVVNFADGGNRSPAYLAINPSGQVPALKLPGGLVITETVAIMCYIASEFGDLGLAPTAPIEHAQWIAVMTRMASAFHPTFTSVVRPDLLVDGAHAQANVQGSARARYGDHLCELNDRLGSSPWLMGEGYTLADAHAFVFYQWGTRAGFPMDDYARLSAWNKRMLQRAAVRRALSADTFRSD